MLAIIVTDQSHIHKEGLDMACFYDGIDQLKRDLSLVGAKLDEVYCCPHTRQEHCPCKKPQTFFIDKAAQKYDLDVTHSFVVGDMGMNDIVMAKNAGAKGVLVLTGVGRGSLTEYRYTWEQYEADYVAENILDAVHWILSMDNLLG
jgi:histidinol-phosphate phosphatase family protein